MKRILIKHFFVKWFFLLNNKKQNWKWISEFATYKLTDWKYKKSNLLWVMLLIQFYFILWIVILYENLIEIIIQSQMWSAIKCTCEGHQSLDHSVILQLWSSDVDVVSSSSNGRKKDCCLQSEISKHLNVFC